MFLMHYPKSVSDRNPIFSEADLEHLKWGFLCVADREKYEFEYTQYRLKYREHFVTVPQSGVITLLSKAHDFVCRGRWLALFLRTLKFESMTPTCSPEYWVTMLTGWLTYSPL